MGLMSTTLQMLITYLRQYWKSVETLSRQHNTHARYCGSALPC